MTLTNDELQAIRARAEAATPGPWTIIPAEPEIDDDGRVIEGAYSYPGGVEDANGDAVCTFGSEDGSGHMFESEDNKIAISQARTDIPALLAHIERLQRRYTMPCPYCDFGSGQRGMDRCPHCDGSGRMDVHVFVAQQRDAAVALVEALEECIDVMETTDDTNMQKAIIEALKQASAALSRVKGECGVPAPKEQTP